MLAEGLVPDGEGPLRACLEAFAQGKDGGGESLPWLECLSPADRDRFRRELALVLLEEPEMSGEPPDWGEVGEILADWAELAGWEGPLTDGASALEEGTFCVHLRPCDEQRLKRAPASVQRTVEQLLAQFLRTTPTDAEQLPRGQLKKLSERGVWQVELPGGYRVRYLVDKPARTVHIVYFGPHPDGDPRGREQTVRSRVRRQYAGSQLAL
jgi:hypothetical protein